MAPPKGIKGPIFLENGLIFAMPSKSEEVHDKIFKIRKNIDKKKAEKERATNLKQKEIKQRKIDKWEKEIVDLQKSIHGKVEEPKKKKRKVYIPDPD